MPQDTGLCARQLRAALVAGIHLPCHPQTATSILQPHTRSHKAHEERATLEPARWRIPHPVKTLACDIAPASQFKASSCKFNSSWYLMTQGRQHTSQLTRVQARGTDTPQPLTHLPLLRELQVAQLSSLSCIHPRTGCCLDTEAAFLLL